jgi:hypothetical protein
MAVEAEPVANGELTHHFFPILLTQKSRNHVGHVQRLQSCLGGRDTDIKSAKLVFRRRGATHA